MITLIPIYFMGSFLMFLYFLLLSPIFQITHKIISEFQYYFNTNISKFPKKAFLSTTPSRHGDNNIVKYKVKSYSN